MAHSFITGDTVVSDDEAQAITKHYTPSVQEYEIETPDEVDNSPLTEAERDSVLKATDTTGDSAPTNGSEIRERADVFMVPGEWVSPVVKARRKQAMMLPNSGQIGDLEDRIGKVMRFGGAPKAVSDLARQARLATGVARETHEASRHPENPRYAASTAAKDETVKAIATATTLVGALEQTAKDASDEWFDGLVADIPAMQAKAAKATEAAAKAYAEWRQTIAAADALAREQGRFGDWHKHPDSRELNPLALIGDLRKARDIAKMDDDFVSGAYLTADYGDEVPPHTMAALKRSAEIAPGSFAEMTFHRLSSVHKVDGPAQDTIRFKDLRIINTSPVPDFNPQQEAWNAHARAVDEGIEQG